MQAASETKEFDGTPLTNGNAYVSRGSLVEGHRLEVEVSGSIVDTGSVNNVIREIRILDENDHDVTDCYLIDKKSGVLTVV